MKPLPIMYRFGLAISLVLFLAACNSEEPTPTPEPTAVADATEEETPAPTEEPTEEPAAEPTATETAVPPTETPEPTPTDEPAAASVGDYETSYETADCEFAIPRGQDVACGYLTVPENRNDVANGRTVRLHVAVFASNNPTPAPDPILYLEGGPGGDALELVPLVFNERFAPFLANHTFIMFDQRGTGYSEPSLSCPESVEASLEVLDDDLSVAEAQDVQLEALTACHERLVAEGVDLTAYNSAESAADVADLRLALGYDEWNLYGISYGTRLAQTVVRDYPQGIRSIILDSTYPLAANLQSETAVNADRAFTVFFAGCAADADCSAAYPDLEQVFLDLIAELNQTPILVEAFNPLTGDQYNVLVDGDFMVGILFQALYSVEITSIMPKLIYDVNDGRTMDLSAVIGSVLAQQEFISQGMQLAVQCHEEIAFSPPGDTQNAANYPFLNDLFDASIIGGQFGFTVCELWQAGQADPVENEMVNSNIPTLILAGEYDPITPPRWGQEVAEGFSNSFYIEFPGVGHGASVSGECPLAVTQSFITDPTTEPDSVCLTVMGGPDFTVPLDSTAAAVELESYSNDAFGISGVKPVGWEELAPGTYVRGATALDQTVLIQQAAPPGLGAEGLLGVLTSQFGLEEVPAQSGEYADANGRTWDLYHSEIQGFPIDLGFFEDDAGLLIVIMISQGDESEILYDTLFVPTMDAIARN